MIDIMLHPNYMNQPKVEPGVSFGNGSNVSNVSNFTMLQLDQKPMNRRERILAMMRHRYFYIGIILLVVLDVFVITVELLISLYAAENIIPKDKHFFRSELALSIIGLIILFCFVLEIITKIVLIGPRYLWNFWHILDTLVVFSSFGLEFYAIVAKDYSHLSGIDNKAMSESHKQLFHLKSNPSHSIFETGLFPLIIIRMWKLVRIIESVVHSTEMKNEQKIGKLKEEKIRTEAKVNHYMKQVNNLKSELKLKNQELKRLNQQSIPSSSDRDHLA